MCVCVCVAHGDWWYHEIPPTRYGCLVYDAVLISGGVVAHDRDGASRSCIVARTIRALMTERGRLFLRSLCDLYFG